MNIFENKKVTIVFLCCVLLIMILILFFPHIFSNGKIADGNQQDPQITQIKTQSSETTVDSIKADLENTDLTTLDKEMELIEKELETAI